MACTLTQNGGDMDDVAIPYWVSLSIPWAKYPTDMVCMMDIS